MLYIFDLDGTLVDTGAEIRDLLNQALAGFSYPNLSLDQVLALLGHGSKRLVEGALAGQEEDPARVAQVLASYLALYEAESQPVSQAYPGIMDLLAWLKGRGDQLAIFTNKPQRATDHLVHRLFGPACFDLVLGQQEGLRRKPDPQGLELIMDYLAYSPGDCLYLGDTEVDVEVAQAAGLDMVLCTWGFRSRQELSSYEVLAQVDRVDQLYELMGEGGAWKREITKGN